MIFAIVASVVVLVGAIAALAIGLASAAGRADHERRRSQSRLLPILGKLRSPSGKPFFAGPYAAPAFLKVLDDVHENL